MKNLPTSAYLGVAVFGLIIVWTAGYTEYSFATALIGSILFGGGLWFAAPRIQK